MKHNEKKIEEITPEKLASLFHDTYETLAPIYGYKTREQTREFDLESSNGKLMVSVCKFIIDTELKQYTEHMVAQTEQRIVGEIEKTPEMVEAHDNDGHRYQIPETRQEDWYTFLEIPSDDERSWDVPEYAERIDGMPVTSFKKTIISRINKNNE